jgi:hypothetical protein
MLFRPHAYDVGKQLYPAQRNQAFSNGHLDRYVLRRIVGARSLVHPITDRHLFPWRRLGKALGADHKAVQRWHAQGIGMIVEALKAAE